MIQNLHSRKTQIVITVGFATFFFGFFAGAVASFYLLSIHSALVSGLRTSLNFKSAIFGDGIILPAANMFAASFLITNAASVTKRILRSSLLLGTLVTVYFHLNQAINGLVNWSMPTPWHWNILGVWHAAYMFSVCTFLALFYLTTFKMMKRGKIPYQFYIVTGSIILFFILLRLDYVTVSVGNLMLR